VESEIHTDPVLLKYLLGDSVDAAVERSIEHKYLTDNDFYEQVLAIEDDLIAAYLRGQLAKREQKLFEERFLISERRNRRLRLLMSLMRPIQGHALGPAQRDASKVLKIFVCGTYDDLREERHAVLECIGRMKLLHDSMEFFGARPNRPIETCLQEVRDSDIIVVILGYRYGTIVPGLDLSFTEAEYQEAFRLGKPCLAYMRDESIPVLPRFMERDPSKIFLLDRFRTTLLDRHTVAHFRNVQDLAVRVAVDLGETIRAVREIAQSKAIIDSRSSPAVTRNEVLSLIDTALAQGMTESELVSTIKRAIALSLVASGRRRPVVYFCHSSSDSALVDRIESGLAKPNIEILRSSAPAGRSEFVTELINAFDKADVIVLLISSQFLQNAWSRREVDLLVARRLGTSKAAIVIPVLVDDVTIPSIIRDIKSVDIRGKPVGEASEIVRDTILRRISEHAQLIGDLSILQRP
jgi:hypothetical protein